MTPPPSYIIENSKKLPFMLRLRDLILTVLVWALYIYFMRDFFFFLRDLWNWGSNGFTNADNYDTFRTVESFVIYFEIMALLGFLFIGWSVYNVLRFRNKKRRRASPPVTIEQIAAKSNLDPEDLQEWQEAQTLVVHYDERGHLTDIIKQ